ncbi:molybdopterin-dependent oxidoreductase [Vibrio vulnificus]|nr:molybdopterin-dependent oxidoreductase [Vibrio vulnificus]
MKYLALVWGLLIAPQVYSYNLQMDIPHAPAVVLTVQDLEQMEATKYTTMLPWLSAPATFTGVKLSTLLAQQYGFIPNRVTLRALNDYAADIDLSDIEKYQPIVAYWQNGKPMRVRDKGPFWLIYPQSSFPKELNIERYHAQMVWQLKQIHIVK